MEQWMVEREAPDRGRSKRPRRVAAVVLIVLAVVSAGVVVIEPVVQAREAGASVVDPGAPPPACKDSWQKFGGSVWPNVIDVGNPADPTRRCYWDEARWNGGNYELTGTPGVLKDGQSTDVSVRWNADSDVDSNYPPPEGYVAKASYRLRFNRSPEFPFDVNPFLRSADGRPANPTVGYDDVFAIPPTWDMSNCLEPEGTSLRWMTDSCQIKLVKGPYYDLPPGQPVPWMLFTAAYNGGYDAAGLDIPSMTNCSVQCPGPPQWWGQRSYMEMPVFIHPSPYAAATKTLIEGRTFRFDGTTTKYNGTIESYHWDFGDGAEGTGAIVEHTFAQPGPYPVTLTVEADGQTSSTIVEVVAEKKVAIDLSIAVSDRTPEIDEWVTVTYSMRNIGNLPITNAAVDVSVEPSGGWTSLDPASQSIPVGATRTQTQQVIVSELPFTIRATAFGTTDGEEIRSLPRQLQIGEPNALDVSLDVSPTDVDLDPEGDGNLEPQPVTATVHVHNSGSSTLEDVDVSAQLNSADDPAPVVVDGGLPDLDIASLPGGESRSFTIELSAVEPGTSDLRVDVTVLSGPGAGMADTDLRTIKVTGAADVSFTWKMPERYAKAADAALDKAKGNPSAWEILLDYEVRQACPTSGTRQWKLNGQVVSPTVVDPAKPCRLKLVRPNLDQFTLSLEAKTPTGTSIGVATQTIQPRDLVIVSLGDSMSSGEGVPQREGRQWENEPCHRSSESGMARAARMIENDGNPATTDDEHSSVTFVHLACSGASTWHVNDAFFRGVTRGGMEDPQLFKLRQIIGDRDVDVVLITIGINDIRFGDVLKHCLFYPDCDLVYFEGQTLTGFLNERIEALEESYARVDRYLEALKIPSSKVRLIEYPDPSIGTHDERCGYKTISAEEMEYLRQHLLLPLNAAGDAAAAANGWTRVRGVAERFSGHGLCAEDSWMVGIFESFAKQGNPDGGFHPNYQGHAQVASIVAPHIPTDGGTGKRVGPTSYPTVSSIAKRGTRTLKVISDVPPKSNTKVTIGAGKVSQETRSATRVDAGPLAGSPAVAAGARAYTLTLDKPLLYDHAVDEMVMKVTDLSPQAKEDRLYVSDGPNRLTGARDLYGEELRAPKAIWYDPPVGVAPAKVQFRVDGKAFTTDATAPFDLIAGPTLTVNGFDPSVLSNGAHTIEARALSAAGAVLASESVPVTVANPAARTIRWSTKAARTPANELNGARVPAGPAYVFLGPSATSAIRGLGPLEWVLDGMVIDSDAAGPYDLGDGGSASVGVAMPAAARKPGKHTLVVRLKLPSGQLHEVARAAYSV